MEKKTAKGTLTFGGMVETITKYAVTGVSNSNTGSRDAFRYEGKEGIVDTCLTFDTGFWETAIEPNGGGMVVVEDYEDKNAAATGHKRWVKQLKSDPELQKLTMVDDIHV